MIINLGHHVTQHNMTIFINTMITYCYYYYDQTYLSSTSHVSRECICKCMFPEAIYQENREK